MQDILFSDFPPITTQEWLDQVTRDLKGKNPDSLKWISEDGLTLFPITSEADIRNEYTGVPDQEKKANDWKVHHDFIRRDPSAVAKTLQQDNNFSLESVGIVLGGMLRRLECAPWPQYLWNPGVKVECANDLLPILGALNPGTEFHITGGLGSIPAYFALVHALQKSGIELNSFSGGIDLDPLRIVMKCGALPFGDDETFAHTAAVIHHAKNFMPGFRTLQVSAEPISIAGGNAVHELAFALSHAVEYADKLSAYGLTEQETLDTIHFVFVTDNDFITEVAKYRAFRKLWARLRSGYGLAAKASYLRTKGSGYNLSELDPHVNLLRTTTQAMSAVIGGADAISVPEFDQTHVREGDFSSRIARNIQLLLRHESHLGKVADPAGGAWYFEHLTQALEEKSWELFLKIESGGGFYQTWREERWLQQMIYDASEKKQEQILFGKEKLIGVNQHPPGEGTSAHLLDMEIQGYGGQPEPELPTHLSEALRSPYNDRTNAIAAALPADYKLSDLLTAMLDEDRVPVSMLPTHRASHDFEQLRRNTEVNFMYEKQRPNVFLFTYGEMKIRRARAAFSANLFGCAGFHVIQSIHSDDVAESLANAGTPAPDIVVMCGDDTTTTFRGVEMIASIKKIFPETRIVLAGRPEGSETWTTQGLDSRIYLGMDMVDYLSGMQRKLGII